ncbi:MAG: hypothetical protein AAF799_10125 [Myxococcota bacterium]
MKQPLTVLLGLCIGALGSMASVATASTADVAAATKPKTDPEPPKTTKKKKKGNECVGNCTGNVGVALIPTCGTGYGLGQDMCKCEDTSGNWGPVIMDCPNNYFHDALMDK